MSSLVSLLLLRLSLVADLKVFLVFEDYEREWEEVDIPLKVGKQGDCCGSFFGTIGDAQTIIAYLQIAESWGERAQMLRHLPIPQAVSDLALLELSDVSGSAVSLVHTLPWLPDSIGFDYGFTTAALQYGLPGIARVRLYDAEAIFPVTTGRTLIDLINTALLEESDCCASACCGDGLPYSHRPGLLLRRVKKKPQEFETIVATGSATHLDVSQVPSDAIAHCSSIHFQAGQSAC